MLTHCILQQSAANNTHVNKKVEVHKLQIMVGFEKKLHSNRQIIDQSLKRWGWNGGGGATRLFVY